MKNLLTKLLFLVFIFSIPQFSNAQDCLPGEECNIPPDPGGEPGHGTGTTGRTPINDYAGLLIASGFIAAMAIYFKKEQLNKQNK